MESAKNLVERYGLENCSDQVQAAYKDRPNELFEIVHFVEPNRNHKEGSQFSIDKKFIYEEDDLFACTDNETSKGFYIKPKDLIQCTGLKDKTGKLIYEGDIVYKQGAKNYKGEKMLSKITFSSDTASFSYCDENGSHDFRTGTSLKMEIVGNVYENPELLKGD